MDKAYFVPSAVVRCGIKLCFVDVLLDKAYSVPSAVIRCGIEPCFVDALLVKAYSVPSAVVRCGIELCGFALFDADCCAVVVSTTCKVRTLHVCT